MAVLAKGTGKIAAETAGRQDIRARVKASQRLLLDRIQGQAGQEAGVVVDYLPAGIAARSAKACLTRRQAAVVLAERTG